MRPSAAVPSRNSRTPERGGRRFPSRLTRRAAPFALLLLMPAVTALAFGDKDEKKFDPGPASSYTTRQTNGKVTVAAVPYTSDEQARTAFGKHNPYQYGILPVLVIVQNDMDEPLRLSAVEAQFEKADGRHIEAVPPQDIASTMARQPRDGQLPGSGPRWPVPLPKKKNPLAEWGIEGRAFSAPMLSPHESAQGFFYFQTRLFPGAKLYLSGMQAARSGEGIIFFEIPLEEQRPAPKN